MPNMRELVADLEARRATVREMGGPDKIKKQHDRGKMTARERVAALFDDGVYFELGAHGTQMGLAAGPEGKDKPPADAVDKVEPPPAPDSRSEAPATMQPGSGAGLPVAQPAGAVAGTRARAFDASEGTPRDPLLNKTFDLNSPKQVPQLKGP